MRLSWFCTRMSIRDEGSICHVMRDVMCLILTVLFCPPQRHSSLYLQATPLLTRNRHSSSTLELCSRSEKIPEHFKQAFSWHYLVFVLLWYSLEAFHARITFRHCGVSPFLLSWCCNSRW